MIEEMNQNESWILEGVLRKNLYYLLEKADKIIYLDIPLKERNRRIFIRFCKQKLGKEKANYQPSFKMLKQMWKWSNEFEKQKIDWEKLLESYAEKLEIRKMK